MRSFPERSADTSQAADDAPAGSSARPPSDRVYAIVGWSLLVLAAGLIVYLFGLARIVPPTRAIAFRLIVTLILVFDALWWRLADRRLARYVVSSRRSALARAAVAVFIIGICIPIADMLARGRMPHYLATLPSPYAHAVVLWHLGLVVLLPSLALARLVLLALGRIVAAMRRRKRTADDDRVPSLDRRRFLQTACVSIPAIALPTATVVARRQESALLKRRVALPAPWLPERLRGLTITHVSDLHVGRHYRPHMLRQLVDAVGEFDSDLLLVTGDIVDVSNDMLPPAIHAFRQMSHRYGMFHCIGNHDQIDDRAAWIAAMRADLDLLIDQRRPLLIAGERLTIAGLDFARRDTSAPGRPSHADHADAALHGHRVERDGSVIALAHHPHAFDALAARGVPLTLSGHTHGGQLMLTGPQSALEFGAGNLLFRYIRGQYRRGDSTLLVSSGVGNWFPLRINAPAEVVQLQLV